MPKKKPKKASPEPLHPAEAAALNRAFYASEPADYFGRRLVHLLRLASQKDAELRAEAGNFKFGMLEMTVPSVEEEDVDEEAHKRYVFVEAEVLLHHTAETVLRMFLAHASRPPVPWIETAQLRGPGEFKRRLKKAFDGRRRGDLHGDIGFVFLGRRSSVELADEAREEEHKERVKRIAGYLRHYADVLLSRSSSYNAVKHGLAMQAGEPAIKIADIKELSAEGPAISHLQLEAAQGKRQWMIRTEWLTVEHELSPVYVGTKLLENLWQFARMRYVDWPMPQEGIRLYVAPIPVEELLMTGQDPDEPAGMITGMSFPPAMHAPPGTGVDRLIDELD